MGSGCSTHTNEEDGKGTTSKTNGSLLSSSSASANGSSSTESHPSKKKEPQHSCANSKSEGKPKGNLADNSDSPVRNKRDSETANLKPDAINSTITPDSESEFLQQLKTVVQKAPKNILLCELTSKVLSTAATLVKGIPVVGVAGEAILKLGHGLLSHYQELCQAEKEAAKTAKLIVSYGEKIKQAKSAFSNMKALFDMWKTLAQVEQQFSDIQERYQSSKMKHKVFKSILVSSDIKFFKKAQSDLDNGWQRLAPDMSIHIMLSLLEMLKYVMTVQPLWWIHLLAGWLC